MSRFYHNVNVEILAYFRTEEPGSGSVLAKYRDKGSANTILGESLAQFQSYGLEIIPKRRPSVKSVNAFRAYQDLCIAVWTNVRIPHSEDWGIFVFTLSKDIDQLKEFFKQEFQFPSNSNFILKVFMDWKVNGDSNYTTTLDKDNLFPTFLAPKEHAPGKCELLIKAVDAKAKISQNKLKTK